MKRVSGRRICKALQAKGWAWVRTAGSHHIYRREGEPRNVSVPVHGNDDLRHGTQRDIMRIAGLSDEDL